MTTTADVMNTMRDGAAKIKDNLEDLEKQHQEAQQEANQATDRCISAKRALDALCTSLEGLGERTDTKNHPCHRRNVYQPVEMVAEMSNAHWLLTDRTRMHMQARARRFVADRQVVRTLERGERRRKVVCLCGSTRFWREYQEAGLRETLAGNIVLSIGAIPMAPDSEDVRFMGLDSAEYERVKAELDALHLDKIDLADEVLVLNVGGYIGESTAKEARYARAIGVPVRFLESIADSPFMFDDSDEGKPDGPAGI